MDMIPYIAVSSLPMGSLLFVGSYFGISKTRRQKLPAKEVIILFFAFWLLAAVLIIVFKVLLSGQDESIQSMIGDLFGPLIIGLIIGRNIVQWRHKVNTYDAVRKTYRTDDK